MKFEIGRGVSVDLDTLINSRLLVQANSGAGKSWALRRLLEQSHGQVQHLVIDPEGEFASLREKFDYVLAAKNGGDTLADPRAAKLLAERLLEIGASAILDIYELKAHERIRFVRLFLEALVDAPKHLWHPAIIIVDEAHMFAPQVGEAESAGAVRDLCTRGRKRGFCAVLATQRLSKLHKDAVAECNNKLIGRSSLDVDMKRAADELGFTTREQQQSLRQMEPGEFFAFGPAISPVVTRVKVGAVSTSHPKAGSKLAGVIPPPPAKIKALLPKLSDLPAEAEARERGIAELKAEVSQLKRELTQAQKAAPKTETTVIEKSVVTDEHVSQLSKLVYELNGIAVKADELSDKAVTIASQIRADMARAKAPVPPPARTPVARTTKPQIVSEPMGDLTGPEQRIIDAIAWLEDVGVESPEQTAVAFLAGYTFGAGGFNNPKGSLRVKGLVEYRPGNQIVLTEAGRAAANHQDGALTTEELHQRVLAKLPGPEQRILRPLLDAYPEEMKGEDVAAAAGYAFGTGGFNNPKGRLRSLGLVDYPRPGYIVAKSLLFLE